MPRKTSPRSRALAAANPNTNLPALPARLAIGDTEIRPAQLFVNTSRHPGAPGPWRNEPDKVAWIDARTGKDCILLRQIGGHWSGFVAVGVEHPLWGYSADAIPASAGLHVHGPIDYAEACDESGSPETSVCHVTIGNSGSARRSAPQRSDTSGDVDRTNWWFGFSADQAADYVPDRKRPLEREEGQVYRDMDYMFHEVTHLASQLDALEDRHTGSLAPPALGIPAPKPGRSGCDHD